MSAPGAIGSSGIPISSRSFPASCRRRRRRVGGRAADWRFARQQTAELVSYLLREVNGVKVPRCAEVAAPRVVHGVGYVSTAYWVSGPHLTMFWPKKEVGHIATRTMHGWPIAGGGTGVARTPAQIRCSRDRWRRARGGGGPASAYRVTATPTSLTDDGPSHCQPVSLASPKWVSAADYLHRAAPDPRRRRPTSPLGPLYIPCQG